MRLRIIFLLAVLVYVQHAMARSKRQNNYGHHNHGPGYINGPRGLRDRIAIVGGGSAGVHMAYMLKKKGFTDVTILEKRRRAGGKSYTLHYRGAPHEMGTCYLAPDYEENIIALMREFTSEQLVHLPSASIWVDKFKMPLTYQQYVGGESMRNFNTTNPIQAFKMLVGAMMKYNKLHQRLFGNYTGELMPRPSEAVLHEIRGTFMDFLKRNGLASLQPIFLACHTMQGYGHLDEVAALYGLIWNTPKLVNGLLKRMYKQMDTGLYMLKHGFQGLWEAMIQKAGLHIEYDVNIQHVYRNRRGTWLCTKFHRQCEFYKFVMWSPELKQSLRKFHEPHEEEVDIFMRMRPVYFSTSLIDTHNVQRGLTSIDYMFSNVLAKREHSVWAQRESYAALRGFNGTAYQNGSYPTGNDGRSLRTTVGYQYGKTKPTRTQLRSIMKTALQKMGATYVKIRQVYPWRYFPRFNPADTRSGILWDIVDMQGKHGMWYIGSSVIFESVKSVVEYNELLISKMRPPCRK